MSRQGEIGEGIRKIVFKKMVELRKTGVTGSIAKDILEYLHSQGVVLKVDTELPELDVAWEDGVSYTAPYKYAQGEMIKTGYVAVESLIEEK